MQLQSNNVFQNQNFGAILSSSELPFSTKQFSYQTVKKYQRDGHWNQKERLKYTVFITYFRSILEDEEKMWTVRIYDMMADMISTRSANQCRSHHQKMLKYKIIIPSIINTVAEKYQPRIYEEFFNKYLILIKGLMENIQRYIRPSANVSQQKKKVSYPIKINTRGASKDASSSIISFKFQQKRKDQIQFGSSKLEIEEGQNKKKEDKRKTADSYDYYSQKEKQEEQIANLEEMPQLKIKESINKSESLPLQFQQINKTVNEIMMPKVFNPQFQFSLCFSNEQKLYYSKQIEVMQIQKQWHCQNAQQLYQQWHSQIEAIRRCEQTINIYSRAVIEK